jgi:WD40 repeat protein
LAAGLRGRTIRIWGISGDLLAVSLRLLDEITLIVWSTDSGVLASALHDGSIRLWLLTASAQ